MKLVRYNPEQWFAYSEAAHCSVFGTSRAPWLDRINYALVAVDGDEPVGFTTCRETDAESVYWQYGGCMEDQRGHKAVRAFRALFDDAQSRYRRCTTYVKNDNVGYLHLAMKYGFRIIGLRNYEGHIMLELHQEFNRVLEDSPATYGPKIPENPVEMGRSAEGH